MTVLLFLEPGPLFGGDYNLEADDYNCDSLFDIRSSFSWSRLFTYNNLPCCGDVKPNLSLTLREKRLFPDKLFSLNIFFLSKNFFYYKWLYLDIVGDPTIIPEELTFKSWCSLSDIIDEFKLFSNPTFPETFGDIKVCLGVAPGFIVANFTFDLFVAETKLLVKFLFEYKIDLIFRRLFFEIWFRFGAFSVGVLQLLLFWVLLALTIRVFGGDLDELLSYGEFTNTLC